MEDSGSIDRWKEVQKENFFSLNRLLSFLELEEKYWDLIDNSSKFPINVPLRLAKKMAKNKITDPLFIQFVPLKSVKKDEESYSLDPLEERSCLVTPFLLKKYRERALLLCTQRCAMHCRYCFRQNYDYPSSRNRLDEELKAIAEDVSLKEIILSGGDPLALPNHFLYYLFSSLEKIDHIRRIRFHTRFPIGIPERIDESFIELLQQFPLLQIYLVIHTNHPVELDQEVLAALKKIQKIGIPILSQTVLLRGVNNSVELLYELYGKLIDNGIIPYYLHQLDQVKGSSYFEVDPNEGKALIEKLKKVLPGYGVPQYVFEKPGAESKTAL